MPTARQLEIFLATAQLGGVGAAARALSISQPAASKQLKSLERQLGGELFRRSNGNLIQLSELGRATIGPAQEMLDMQLRMEGLHKAPLRAEKVSIVLMPFLLGKLQAMLEECFPEDGPVKPELLPAQGDLVSSLDQIRGDPTGFALFHNSHLPSDASFDVDILGVEPCGLYVSARHPSLDEVRNGDLNLVDWIVPDTLSQMTTWSLQMLAISGVTRDRIVTGDRNATSVLDQVHTGASGGIFMDSHIRAAGFEDDLVRLPQPIASLYLLLITNRSCDPRLRKEMAQRLVHLVRPPR